MRKLILFNMITLDGFFEGPKGEIDWHVVDGDFNKFAVDQLNSVDTLIFGRKTYQLMESYWPTPAALEDSRVIAKLMNDKPKIVFSRKMLKANWAPTRIMTDPAAVEELKNQPGKDLIIFGSAELASAFLKLGILDEVRFIVNPILMGEGRPVFNIMSRQKLKLIRTQNFDSGNVLLCYHPDR